MRHAVYFTPDPAGALHELGSVWLGRDVTGKPVTAKAPDPRLGELAADARRYGFHATLKPPFRLKDNAAPGALENAVARLAREHARFEAGVLELSLLDGFLALTLAEPAAALTALADDCVSKLDNFRAPAGEGEIARRRAAGLSLRQDELLVNWGYPYVFEEFRFHMTLTRRLSKAEQSWAEPLARRHFASVLGRPLTIDALTILQEAEDGAPFLMAARLPLVEDRRRAA